MLAYMDFNNLACPNCHARHFEMPVMATAIYDGMKVDLSTPEYTSETPCKCLDCGFEGQAGHFEGQEEITRNG